jgi:hypothetical protein
MACRRALDQFNESRFCQRLANRRAPIKTLVGETPYRTFRLITEKYTGIDFGAPLGLHQEVRRPAPDRSRSWGFFIARTLPRYRR